MKENVRLARYTAPTPVQVSIFFKKKKDFLTRKLTCKYRPILFQLLLPVKI